MVNKKIIIGIVVLLVIIGASLFIGLGRQGFYLINGAACYTETNAKSAMQAEIKLKGFCSNDCELRDKSSEFCPSNRPYVVFCKGGTQGTCGTDNRIDECPRGDIDCNSDERCKKIMAGNYKSRCYEFKDVYCNINGYEMKNGDCVRKGCQSDSSCPSGNTCEYKTGFYLCQRKSECNGGEFLCVSGNKFPCENGQWKLTSIEACEVDTLGGTFTSINMKLAVSKDSSLIINGFFLPSATGKYYIEGGIDVSTRQPLFIVAKAGQSCDGDKHFAGASKELTKGKPEEFTLEVLTPSESGKYKVSVGAYPGCGKEALVSVTKEIMVGEPDSVADPVDLDDVDPGTGDFLTAGDDCIEDYIKTCNDESTITVFKCVEKFYEATNEICEGEIGGDGDGGGYSERCIAYKEMKDGDCVFSFKNMFTKSGIKESWNDFMWWILGIGLGIVVIIILIIILSKKEKSMF